MLGCALKRDATRTIDSYDFIVRIYRKSVSYRTYDRPVRVIRTRLSYESPVRVYRTCITPLADVNAVLQV